MHMCAGVRISRETCSMVDIPETRYAKTADGVHIAYQVLGDGPFDLVLSTGTSRTSSSPGTIRR